MAVDALDLTTVAAVRSFMQHDADVALDNDTLVQELITRASYTIADYTGREFKTTAAADSSRRVLYYNDPGHVIRLTPYDVQSVTRVTLDPETSSPTVLTDSSEWRLLPIPSRYSAYHSLYLPNYGGSIAGRIVDVKGTWGWPSVPHEIAQACISTVVHWLKTETPGGDVMGDDRDKFGPVLFPSSARMTLKRYRLVRV